MLKQLLALLFISTLSMGTKAQEIIHLTSGEWSPYLSENLKYYGIASRIVSEAFALEGVKVEYYFRPWKRAYKEAEIGEYNGSLVWSKNSQREKSFYYSDTVIEGESVFFHLKSYPFNWDNIEDLSQEKVGAILGNSYTLLEKLEQEGKLSIHRVATNEQNYRMLLLNRINIFQQDKKAGYYWLREHFTPREVEKLTHHPKVVAQDSYHLILSKNIERNKYYMSLFNKGLAKLKQNGKYALYIGSPVTENTKNR